MPTAEPLTDEEIERYRRHLVLRELGFEGQARLKGARVLVVGAGGVGCPAALYLAAAGVGLIEIADFDAVGLSNLQRQILFATEDVGRLKAEAAADRLEAVNTAVVVRPLGLRLDADNVAEAAAGCDLVLDGCDDFGTRLLVSDACVAAGVPLVSAAMLRWEGMVGAFRGAPCYRCLVNETPPDAELCVAAGVVGALGGVVGSWAALLAIRVLTGAGEDPWGRVTRFETLSGRVREATVLADPSCPACGGGRPLTSRR